MPTPPEAPEPWVQSAAAAAAELKAAQELTYRGGDETQALRAKLAVTGLVGLVLAGCGSGAAKRSPYTAEGLKIKVEQQLVGARKKVDASHGHPTTDGLAPRASCKVRTSTTLRCNVIDVNLRPFGGETVDVTVDPQTGQTRTTGP